MTLEEYEKLESERTQGDWVHGFWSGRCHEKHKHSREVCNYEYTINKADAEDEWTTCIISLADRPIEVVTTTSEYGAIEFKDAQFIAVSASVSKELIALVRAAKSFGNDWSFSDLRLAVENFEKKLREQ